ncbi:hypothetical protein KBC31_05035 [Candidatus Saccharibacteria bacterium]|jgi:hypothetical protein|nr:hypothetical protein [Candidatus Saccharibacteria bacterium]
MIQINLLPDVKREYIKAQQMKRMFVIVSVVITVASLTLLALLFVFVQFGQPQHIKHLQSDIDTSVSKLKGTKDVVKIVSVQGVLEQLPKLQDGKFKTSRLFGYVTGFTPQGVSYTEIKLDLNENVLTLTGQSTDLEQANVLANNLKSANFVYKQDNEKQTMSPFKSIIFSSLGKVEQADNGKNVNFQLSFSFDPILFNESITEPAIAVNGASERLLLPTDKPFNEPSATGAPQ